jgi:hypothetical protein
MDRRQGGVRPGGGWYRSGRNIVVTLGEAPSYEFEVAGGVNQDEVRWAQVALNDVLRLQLATDGDLGTNTRNAIRTFQRGRVPETGALDPGTVAALVVAFAGIQAGTSACDVLQEREILDLFDQNKSDVAPAHEKRLAQIALCVRDSQRTTRPIRSIRLIGHTSTEGNEDFNERLGQSRADRVSVHLTRALNRVQAGLAGQVALPTESHGELESRNLGPQRDRRVEVVLPPRVAQICCPPFTSRVRLHVKILVEPTRFTIARMLASMQEVYRTAGIQVEVGSFERLTIHDLEDVDIFCPGNPASRCCPFPCASNNLNPEYVSLFQHRDCVGPDELAVYFVNTTIPGLNGCCAHPPGRQGVVVTAGASEWTLGHEVAHVLGLQHVNNKDRLMNGGPGTGGTNAITNPPPDLTPAEIQTMEESNLTILC